MGEEQSGNLLTVRYIYFIPSEPHVYVQIYRLKGDVSEAVAC